MVDANIFISRINRFIYQQPRPNEPVLTISGAFPLLEYVQTNATLSGLDLATTWKLSDHIDWNGKASFLYARDRTAGGWLIGMPANRFSNELTYTFPDGKLFTGNYISGELQHVMKQTRTPDEINGKQDYKDPPGAYALANFNIASTIKLKAFPVTINVGVRNAFDVRYRDYLNSMRYFTDQIGRNISVQLKIPIVQSKHI
jgi:iron complex outermembrane receptor protein